MSELATVKKRRGVARASITRLIKQLKDLESGPDQPATLNLARAIAQKLEILDTDFRTHHHALIDLVNDEEKLLVEQGTLDEHDDSVAELSDRIQRFISICTPSSDRSSRKITLRRLSYQEKSLTSIGTAIVPSDASTDICLYQYEEELTHHKKELAEIRYSLLLIDLDDDDEISTLQGNLEKRFLTHHLKLGNCYTVRHVKSIHPRLISTVTVSSYPNLTCLRSMAILCTGEHFGIHNCSNLSDSEKLVYLQQSLKDGSATIEGLSCSGEYYTEAIECLKTRYDRPRLIHQTHVRKILDAPSLK